jgi:hypothetical protein
MLFLRLFLVLSPGLLLSVNALEEELNLVRGTSSEGGGFSCSVSGVGGEDACDVSLPFCRQIDQSAAFSNRVVSSLVIHYPFLHHCWTAVLFLHAQRLPRLLTGPTVFGVL